MIKTELQTIRDIKEQFETSYQNALNILSHSGNCAPSNINFYNRQRDWSCEYVIRYVKLYNALIQESPEARVMRALSDEENLETLDKIIVSIQYRKREIIALREEEENFKREQEAIKREQRRKRVPIE